MTYTKILAEEISTFIQDVEEFLDDPLIKEIVDCFNKIRNFHQVISQNLKTQKKDSEWQQIHFTQAFVKIYPKSINDYVYFCNNWELLVKKNAFFFQNKKSSK